MEKEFSHYFIDKQHKKSDYFNFDFVFDGKRFKFTSVDNVFSKSEIDEGSLVLINTVIKNFNLNGQNCLDFGCGYGAIGILLKSKFNNANFLMSDVTNTAVELSKINLNNNNLNCSVIQSDSFNNIKENFNFIITNPPIKSGKTLLFNLVSESFKHLEEDGKLVLVIRKSHGEESLKKHMENLFGNCEILKRDKGYYILCSEKLRED